MLTALTRGATLSACLLLANAHESLGQSTRTGRPRPKVLVIATGGTIAGVQDKPGTTGDYKAGTLTAEQIVASVPELATVAQVETEQFSNVASSLITPLQWVALAKRINLVLKQRGDLAGVVVTHGTDRLEETAFFLYLTIRSDKPVIVVGSQRPATGVSPDGPMNLLGAVRTAASPAAVGKGVLVELDDRLISAREVRKLYQRTGGFSGGDMGLLGVVTTSGPEFFYAPVRRHGSTSEFDLSRVDSLPQVELTFSYPGGTGPLFASPPAGVVVATTGLTRAEGSVFRALRGAGTVIVTSFPSGDNVNQPRSAAEIRSDTVQIPKTADDSLRVAERALPPTVVTQHLTPQKARILLMLALTRTRDPREVQRYFVEY